MFESRRGLRRQVDDLLNDRSDLLDRLEQVDAERRVERDTAAASNAALHEALAAENGKRVVIEGELASAQKMLYQLSGDLQNIGGAIASIGAATRERLEAAGVIAGDVRPDERREVIDELRHDVDEAGPDAFRGRVASTPPPEDLRGF